VANVHDYFRTTAFMEKTDMGRSVSICMFFIFCFISHNFYFLYMWLLVSVYRV